MTERDPLVMPLPPAPRRWPRFVVLTMIFVCGVIVGAVGGRQLAQRAMLTMLRHPEQIPDRMLPRLKSSLDLTEDQSRRVTEIVKRRHAAMESIRARGYPDLIWEFHSMRTEIAEQLTPDQKGRWESLASFVEERYLPAAPGQSTIPTPPANTL